MSARRVGEAGRVVGVDTRAMAPLGLPNVRVVQGDAGDDEVIDEALRELGGRADVVLSDMSPSLSGVRDRDEARASDLVRLALAVTARVLRPGGSFVCKIFMNSEYGELRDTVARRFQKVSTTRSDATRKGSAELYLVARGFRGRSCLDDLSREKGNQGRNVPCFSCCFHSSTRAWLAAASASAIRPALW